MTYPESSATPGFDAPEKKKGSQKPPKPKNQEIKLPAMVEFVLTFSWLGVLATAIVVAALSYLSGSSLMVIFTRTAVAIIVIGVLLWAIAYLIMQTSLDVARQKYEMEKEEYEKKKKEEEAAHTMEMDA